LELGSEQLEFIKAIKEGTIDAAAAVQQAADFTLSSAAGEEALFEIVEKIVAQEQARQSLLDKQATTIKKLSALQVQVATKNAMALVREAAALRQIAKDQEETIERRAELLTQAAAKEIESFKIQAAANIKNQQEVAAATLQINAKLKADLDKLFGSGQDFEAIARKQVKIVNDIEQELLQNDIDRLQRRLEIEKLTVEERERILDEIAETRRTKAQAQSEFLLTNEELTAEERELISIKLGKSLEEIENDRVDAVKNANKEILDSDKELQEQREAIADARINTAKNVANVLSTLAGDDERRQQQIQDLQKALAVSEILINLRKEVSGIREKNASKEGSEILNRAQILQARTAALAGVAGILSAYEGVDDTGNGGDLDSKGGFLMKAHPREQMFSHANRKEVANPKTGKLRTRREIMDQVHIADNLMMSPHAFKQMEVGQIVQPKEVNLKALVSEQKSSTATIKKAIEDNATKEAYGINKLGELIYSHQKGEVKRTVTVKRSRL